MFSAKSNVNGNFHFSPIITAYFGQVKKFFMNAKKNALDDVLFLSYLCIAKHLKMLITTQQKR